MPRWSIGAANAHLSLRPILFATSQFGDLGSPLTWVAWREIPTLSELGLT